MPILLQNRYEHRLQKATHSPSMLKRNGAGFRTVQIQREQSTLPRKPKQDTQPISGNNSNHTLWTDQGAVTIHITPC